MSKNAWERSATGLDFCLNYLIYYPRDYSLPHNHKLKVITTTPPVAVLNLEHKVKGARG